MARGILLIGTDTGVGKTVVCAAIMHRMLALGLKACYFKPVASGMIPVDGMDMPGDAWFVKTFSGLAEDVHSISPCCFRTPVSPHLAARMEASIIDIDAIRQSMSGLKESYDYIVAEGCGGLAVPLNDRGYMLAHLVRGLGFDCILAARAGLGTINHTLMTLSYAGAMGIGVRGIIFSGCTGSVMEKDNIETIRTLSGLPVLGMVPVVPGVDVDRLAAGNLKEIEDRAIDLQGVLSVMGELP